MVMQSFGDRAKEGITNADVITHQTQLVTLGKVSIIPINGFGSRTSQRCGTTNPIKLNLFNRIVPVSRPRPKVTGWSGARATPGS